MITPCIQSACLCDLLQSPFSLLQYLNSQHTSLHHGLIKVKGSFGETFHLNKTVVRTGVLGIQVLEK